MKISNISTGNKLKMGKIFGELVKGDYIYVADGKSSKQEDIVYIVDSVETLKMAYPSIMYTNKNPDKKVTRKEPLFVTMHRETGNGGDAYEYVPKDIIWYATIYTLQDYLLIATKLEDIYMMIDKYKLKSKLI